MNIKIIFTLVMVLFSFNLLAKQVSFDCEGSREDREDQGDTNSKFEIDIDLEKETGTFCSVTKGWCRDYSAIELNPKFLKGYIYSDYLQQSFESLYIDRKTLDANVSDWIGKCVVVDRSEEQQF